eukprot:m.116806 g.116806  ORF g.116806 m.116806 type:complete len:317 (-) comp10929_c0_seq1:76-1026(-)
MSSLKRTSRNRSLNLSLNLSKSPSKSRSQNKMSRNRKKNKSKPMNQSWPCSQPRKWRRRKRKRRWSKKTSMEKSRQFVTTVTMIRQRTTPSSHVKRSRTSIPTTPRAPVRRRRRQWRTLCANAKRSAKWQRKRRATPNTKPCWKRNDHRRYFAWRKNTRASHSSMNLALRWPSLPSSRPNGGPWRAHRHPNPLTRPRWMMSLPTATPTAMPMRRLTGLERMRTRGNNSVKLRRLPPSKKRNSWVRWPCRWMKKPFDNGSLIGKKPRGPRRRRRQSKRQLKKRQSAEHARPRLQDSKRRSCSQHAHLPSKPNYNPKM